MTETVIVDLGDLTIFNDYTPTFKLADTAWLCKYVPWVCGVVSAAFMEYMYDNPNPALCDSYTASQNVREAFALFGIPNFIHMREACGGFYVAFTKWRGDGNRDDSFESCVSDALYVARTGAVYTNDQGVPSYTVFAFNLPDS